MLIIIPEIVTDNTNFHLRKSTNLFKINNFEDIYYMKKKVLLEAERLRYEHSGIANICKSLILGLLRVE
jgi:hypothetical protein